jgi:hypothetical protein
MLARFDICDLSSLPLLLLLLCLWHSCALFLLLQRLVAMRSETLHKDEMLRLLTAEVK